MNKQAVKRRIERLLQRFASATSQRAYSALIPSSLMPGKLYEAHVLSKVIEELSTHEHFQIVLKNTSFVPLKSSPGPINRNYAYFELRQNGNLRAELWTDVQFISLSCHQRGNANSPGRGDFHELDIMVTEPHVNGRPYYSQIWLAVECKNTGYTPNLLREILGVRRELSFLRDGQSTRFTNWPRTSVPAYPPSCLMVYSTDPSVVNFSGPGEVFGIDFRHEPI